MKTRVAATAALALALFSIGALTSCNKSQKPTISTDPPARPSERRLPSNRRNAIPIATPTSARSTSTPAGRWMPGSWATASPGPDEALKYAQGQTIKHPLGYDIKIDTPMDFMGVTDHSEYVGVTKEANTPGSAMSKLARGTAA